MLKKILPVFIAFFAIAAVNAQPGKKAVEFYKAGLKLKSENKFPDALVAFNTATRFYLQYDSAWVEAGTLYRNSNQLDYSIFCYNRAIAVSPKMEAAWIALGNLYRDVKPNLDSALICFSKALSIDSTNKETYYSMAWCYNAKSEFNNAIPYAIKALEIDNNYRAAYNELGHAYRRSEKFAEAIAQFKKNIAISPVDLAMLYAGYCYTMLKDKEGALEQYEALKKINEKMAASLKKQIDALQ